MSREGTERISNATRAADRRDAKTTGHADRLPTPEEEAAAEALSVDPEAAAQYHEMAERGAQQKGEGRMD